MLSVNGLREITFMSLREENLASFSRLGHRWQNSLSNALGKDFSNHSVQGQLLLAMSTALVRNTNILWMNKYNCEKVTYLFS